jgi:hypothetical protein
MCRQIKHLLTASIAAFIGVGTKSIVSKCHICGELGNLGIKYPNIVVGNTGKTCIEAAFDIIKNTDATKCKEEQIKWKTCCNGKPPGQISKPMEIQIPKVQYTGPYKRCNVCRNGVYPKTTSMVLNLLYYGTGSCKQYYIDGLTGKIPDHLCSALQYYAYEPCGCENSRHLLRKFFNNPSRNIKTNTR